MLHSFVQVDSYQDPVGGGKVVLFPVLLSVALHGNIYQYNALLKLSYPHYKSIPNSAGEIGTVIIIV